MRIPQRRLPDLQCCRVQPCCCIVVPLAVQTSCQVDAGCSNLGVFAPQHGLLVSQHLSQQALCFGLLAVAVEVQGQAGGGCYGVGVPWAQLLGNHSQAVPEGCLCFFVPACLTQ